MRSPPVLGQGQRNWTHWKEHTQRRYYQAFGSPDSKNGLFGYSLKLYFSLNRTHKFSIVNSTLLVLQTTLLSITTIELDTLAEYSYPVA
jgi:hypothetical protein